MPPAGDPDHDSTFSHSLLIACVFTLLYSFFLFSEPGPGFAHSMLAEFDFSGMIQAALILGLASYFISIFLILVSEGIFSKLFERFADPAADSLFFSIKVAFLLAYVGVITGTVSLGGFSFG